MSVRPAKIGDTMRLIGVMEEGCAQSIYKDAGGVDTKLARSLIARSIQAHGHGHAGATLLLVAHNGDDITGYFWGVLDRVYQVGTKLTATEVHFYCTSRANPYDGISMLSQFFRWANSIEDCIEVLIGKTSIIAADDGRYEAYLKRKGFETFGTIYRKPIERKGDVSRAA